MSRRGALIAPILCVLALAASPAAGWLFDRGLEDDVARMKALFGRRDLIGLYDAHVDPRLRAEFEKSALVIQKDRANGEMISRRLRYPAYGEFLRDSPRGVIGRFFHIMNNPPRQKGAAIHSAEYLKLALQLTILLAPFDEGMGLVRRDIAGVRARLYFAGNNLKMIAYFVNRDSKWYLTRKGL